jgi:predicted PurR-regulated permease PerM
MNNEFVGDAVLHPSAPIEKDEELRVPLDARTAALLVLAVVVVPFALYAGAAFFIPLLVSLFLSYALSPLVDRMESLHLPRAVGAAITMLLVIALAGAGVQGALNGATDVLEELPQAVQNLRFEVTSWVRDGQGPLKQVRKTADELQKLAGATTTDAKPATLTPAPAATTPDSKSLMVTGTAGMAIFLSQLVSVLFLTYFLLAAGDLFRRRLMQAIGPSLARRKKALQILQEVHTLTQRYFALVLAMNIAVGIITSLGLYLVDVRHAVFWGIAMAILHTIPYLGAVVVAGAVGLSAFMQFESAGQALAVASVPLAATALIGIWLQTALMGRAARMNAVVVFVALLFWGMVWGGWGLLLAFPIMATIKIVFGEIDRLKPIALLMGD